MKLPSATSSLSHASIMCPSSRPRHTFVFVPRTPTPPTPDLPPLNESESFPEPCLLPRLSARVPLQESLHRVGTQPSIPIRYSKRMARIRPKAVDEDSIAQVIKNLPHSEERLFDHSHGTLKVLLQRNERERGFAARRLRRIEFECEKHYVKLHATRRNKLREARDFQRENERKKREAAAQKMAAEQKISKEPTSHMRIPVTRLTLGFNAPTAGNAGKIDQIQTNSNDEDLQTLRLLERELTRGSVVRPATASTEQPFSRQISLLSRETSRIRMPLSGRQSPSHQMLLPPLTSSPVLTRFESLQSSLPDNVSVSSAQVSQSNSSANQLTSQLNSQQQTVLRAEPELRSLTTVRPERKYSLSQLRSENPRKQRTEPADARLNSYLTLPEMIDSGSTERSSSKADAEQTAKRRYGSDAKLETNNQITSNVVHNNKHNANESSEYPLRSPVMISFNKEKYRRDKYRQKQREWAIEMALKERLFFEAIQEEFMKK